jgi:hypothetical protein
MDRESELLHTNILKSSREEVVSSLGSLVDANENKCKFIISYYSRQLVIDEGGSAWVCADGDIISTNVQPSRLVAKIIGLIAPAGPTFLRVSAPLRGCQMSDFTTSGRLSGKIE